MNKENLSIFLEKPVSEKNLRKAIVTKGGDIIEIITNDYQIEDDKITIKQAKSQRYNKVLNDVEILYVNIDYLTSVTSLYM